MVQRERRDRDDERDIFTLIKADHERLRELFKRIGCTTEREPENRAELFSQLRDELSAHSHAEQETLYEALLERVKDRESILEAYEEHGVADMLLADIETCEPDDERWLAKVTVLKEMVEHHVQEEEDELFKQARKVLSNQEAIALADAMRARKAEEL
jgi:hypothetical protein